MFCINLTEPTDRAEFIGAMFVSLNMSLFINMIVMPFVHTITVSNYHAPWLFVCECVCVCNLCRYIILSFILFRFYLSYFLCFLSSYLWPKWTLTECMTRLLIMWNCITLTELTQSNTRSLHNLCKLFTWQVQFPNVFHSWETNKK